MANTIFIIALVAYLGLATALFHIVGGVRDLNFMTDAQTFDRIGIAEGKIVSLTIDERDAPADLASGKVLWITGGDLAGT